MLDITTALAGVTAGIASIGALGTAASGLVDATKVLRGGVSNAGFGRIRKALAPFKTALDSAENDWSDTIRANWINGMAKNDQKEAAKSLIRLGLSSTNAASMAQAGHVDATRLQAVMAAIETGQALTSDQINILGRFNGAIDAAMDAGFELADQEYRNWAKLLSGLAAVGLATWGGYIIATAPPIVPAAAAAPAAGAAAAAPVTAAVAAKTVAVATGAAAAAKLTFLAYLDTPDFWRALLIGIIAVPLAPVAKDLTSSVQAAVGAMKGGGK